LLKVALCLAFNLMFGALAQAQLRIDTSIRAVEIVNKWLLQSGGQLIVSNVRYKGSRASMGTFINESPEVLLNKGVILSTGNVFDARGPNNQRNTGTKGSGLQDLDIQSIATSTSNDAASLEFDLISLRDSISFTYVFASEEYPEYVNKGVNDLFAFFVSEVGGNSYRPTNIARLPNSRTVVNIDNVNHIVNHQYFLPSDFLHAHDLDFWSNHREMFMRSQIFEFTIPLEAKVKLRAGVKYHLKIAISDVGDRYFDSAVMIKAHSLSAKGDQIPDAEKLVKREISQRFKSNNGIELKNDLSFDLSIHFNSNQAVILEKSFPELNELIELLQDFNDLRVKVVGHTDSDGSETDNQQLSESRAEAVRNYLLSGGIESNRIQTAGRGESEPVSGNQTSKGKAKNRRVEFQLRY